MPIDNEVLLFVGVLAVLSLAWNVYVLAYAWRSRPLKSGLAEERPFTWGAIKTVVRIVVCTIFAVVLITFTTTLRNYYTLDAIANDAPGYVLPLIMLQYVAIYAYSALPATFLFFVVWALKERDRLINLRLRRHDGRHERPRRRNARTD